MNTNTSRIFTILTALVLALSVMFSLSACKDEKVVQTPTDNDLEGWFSAELLNEYSAAGFSLPEGTEVIDKPERNTLYLTGDEDSFKNSVLYAYYAIAPVNDKVYLPELSVDENGVAEVSALKEISEIDESDLYPDGETTSVSLIYKTSHRVLECSITLEKTAETNEDQVCISFSDRTDAYGDLI
ncbi:MAG: hypothetical protein IJC86_04875 [Clostridia bacterium]|nr:hypothetical protein [Clostridia bacterium]